MMMTFEELLETVGRLSPEQLDELNRHISNRLEQIQREDRESETPQERTASMLRAFEQIREDMSSNALDELVEAMNAEYIDPHDLAMFEWLDDGNGV